MNEKQKKDLEKRPDKRAKESIKKMKGRVETHLSGFLRSLLVGLLVVFQLVIFMLLPFFLHDMTVYFYFIMEIASLIFVLVVTNERKSTSYKVSWMCIVLLLPVSGVVMYALWGKTGKRNKLQKRCLDKILAGRKYEKQDVKVLEEFCEKHPVSSRMSRYMSNQGFPLYKNNKVEYFSMGEDAFERMFEDFKQAKKFILIDFFIVADGALWDRMHEILLKKVKEGVNVKFMYDDWGAMLRTERDFAKNLQAEGFQVQIFNPIHKYTDKLFLNFRSHQKIVVIDGNIGYTGGYNIADEYANLVDRFGIWKDTGLRIEGDAVWGMTTVFLQMWNVCCNYDAVDYNAYRPTKAFEKNDTYCHVLSDGPALNPNMFIETMYKQMINYAGEKVYIMTPYLILEEYMVQSLVEAKKRGVDVRIVTPSIPDKRQVKWLTEYNYGALLKNGVRIFEYKPGFVHAKMIMTEHSAIVGTINMDYRSFYLHYENGIWVYDENIVNEIYNDFEKTFSICEEITYEQWKNRPFPLRMIQYFLNVFATLV